MKHKQITINKYHNLAVKLKDQIEPDLYTQIKIDTEYQLWLNIEKMCLTLRKEVGGNYEIKKTPTASYGTIPFIF